MSRRLMRFVIALPAEGVEIGETGGPRPSTSAWSAGRIATLSNRAPPQKALGLGNT